MYNLIYFFLLFSGFTSMIYQIVWLRLFALSVGSTALSLSIVVGSFFLGMGIGSFVSRYITKKRVYTIIPYLFVEIIIAVSAIASLPLLLNLDKIVTTFTFFADNDFFKFLLVFASLLIPTAAMGASLPIISTLLIHNKKNIGNIFSKIYSLNTLGAVLGAFIGGFVIIPSVGLDGAIYIAFCVNISIGVLAFIFFRKKNFQLREHSIKSPKQSPHINSVERKKALAILFITGFVSIATEIGWSKFLIIFTGSTIYGFSAIISVLLLGIAVGSWSMRKRIDAIVRKQQWLLYSLLILSLSLLITAGMLTHVATIYEFLNRSALSVNVQSMIKLLVIFILIFPPSFLFGTIFPLSISLYAQNEKDILKNSSTAFALNTVAGIAGSITAGLWIIPHFGTSVLLFTSAATVAISSILFFKNIEEKRDRYISYTLLFTSLSMIFVFAKPDFKPMIAATYNHTQFTPQDDLNITYVKEGKSGVIALLYEQARYVRVLNNGLSESSLDIYDPDNVNLAETLLAIIPYLLHKNPKNAFIIGFGGGTTAYAMTRTDLKSIQVVELEPQIVTALKTVYKNGIPALEDKRLKLTINDARNQLLKERNRYDIIVSQPSHPWLSGASSLFTKEFFELTKQKIKDDGIYGQWINLFNMDSTTLKSIIKAFVDTYPYTMSFAIMQTEDFLLFGSKKPFVTDTKEIQKKLNNPKIANLLYPYNIYTPKALFAYKSLSRQKLQNLTRNQMANSDLNIISETRLSKLEWRKPPQPDEDPYLLFR